MDATELTLRGDPSFTDNDPVIETDPEPSWYAEPKASPPRGKVSLANSPVATCEAGMASPRLTVARVLRRYLPRFLQEGGLITGHQRHIVDQLTRCRTPALGGHQWSCPMCHRSVIVSNSCKCRHCPTCGGRVKADWYERIASWSVPTWYFHLVFTLPHDVHPLLRGNRAAIYRLLFCASSQALLALAAEELGAMLGLVSLLHTWGQRMLQHVHTHVLCPGGGLALDGHHWVSSPSRQKLVSRSTLRTRYRDAFVGGLRKLHARQQLQLTGCESLSAPAAFEKWLEPLAAREWIVHCEGPPTAENGAQAAMKYLTRYVQGTAIGDRRLLEDDGEYVTFSIKDYRHGGVRATERIRGTEFVRRFLLHLLPKGFQRVRYHGIYSHRRREVALARCRQLFRSEQEESSPHGEPPHDNNPHDNNPHDTDRQDVIPRDPDTKGADTKDADTKETGRSDAQRLGKDRPDAKWDESLHGHNRDEATRMLGPRCPECKQEMLYVREYRAQTGWRRFIRVTDHLDRQMAPTADRIALAESRLVAAEHLRDSTTPKTGLCPQTMSRNALASGSLPKPSVTARSLTRLGTKPKPKAKPNTKTKAKTKTAWDHPP